MIKVGVKLEFEITKQRNYWVIARTRFKEGSNLVKPEFFIEEHLLQTC